MARDKVWRPSLLLSVAAHYMSETPQLTHPGLLERSLPRTIEKSLAKTKKTHFVIGVDEAGRGPLAGPVVAAAFVFTKANGSTPPELATGVNDSKQVTEEAREFMYYNNIRDNANVKYKVAIVDNRTIDKINILQATFKAMTECATALIQDVLTTCPSATFSILVDGNKVPPALQNTAHYTQFVIKGDSLEFVIAAASICAKVERDQIMKELDVEFPVYGFAQHKGYGTGAHVAAIKQHGGCKHHRMTFAPLKFMGKNAVKRKQADVAVDTTTSTSADAAKTARDERMKRRALARE